MKEHIIPILKIIAPISVALIVFAQGLKISPRQAMMYFKERPGLMLRSLLAVLVLVPAAALAIILLLKPSPEVAIGLAILVACPPAPLMIKATPKVGQGSAAYMASLHLSLAALAFFTVPMGLYLLSMPLGFHAEVDLLKMAMILGRTILIPIILGMAVLILLPSVRRHDRSQVGEGGHSGVARRGTDRSRGVVSHAAEDGSLVLSGHCGRQRRGSVHRALARPAQPTRANHSGGGKRGPPSRPGHSDRVRELHS